MYQGHFLSDSFHCIVMKKESIPYFLKMFTSVHRAYKSVSHSPAMKERRNLPLDEIMKALKRIKISNSDHFQARLICIP